MSGKTVTSLSARDEYVVVDIETTGLSTKYCEIIELGAIKFSNGEIRQEFQQLVRPREYPISEFIENLTGITNEMLRTQPSASVAISDFVDFIGRLPVLGHNVCFDKAFIEHAYGQPLECEYIDTMRIARHVFPEMKDGYSLYNVFKECRNRNPDMPMPAQMHRALTDCITTAQCYETLKPLLIEKYGEDPESGYQSYKKTRQGQHTSPAKKPSDYEPTVEEIDDSNPFYGSTVCFTGKLEHFTRDEAMQQVVNLGAIPKSSVSKKLDYLILGSFDFVSSLKGKKSSKLKNAEQLILNGAPLQIVSEDFLLDFCEK